MRMCLRIGSVANMTKIRLHKDIYPLWAVNKGISDYAALAVITDKDDGEYHVCQFEKCRYEESLTVNEFLNYLIDVVNSQGNKA